MKLLVPVLLAVFLALAVGTAIGYYLIPDDSEGTSAQCLILKRDVAKLTYNSDTPLSLNQRIQNNDIVKRYNEECR